ncbi:MAG: IPT/TIG domain-containing protein [Thermoleophilaceae bacterium]
MRRFLALSLLTLVAVVALATSAFGATPRPVITKFSPAQVPVGQVLVLTGKNFRRGVKNNRVYFRRASDGKTVRTRPRKATKTRIEVVVPAKVADFLTVDANGAKQPTRFQIGIFTTVFGPYTKKSRSPLIAAPGTTVGPNGVPVVAAPPPPPDCDADGIPDDTDTDDDNDSLPDDVELQIGTDKCKKDTDADGVEDGYEYWSAVDLNNSYAASTPYPGKKPYPNPLDANDGIKDYDGDGMTQKEEFAAWDKFGGRTLPSGLNQSFPYSDGNQTSPAGNGPGAMDLDENGRITDDEKDVDGDGLPNWVELAKGDTDPSAGNNSDCAFATNTGPNAGTWVNGFTDCGLGRMPNGNTFGNLQGSTASGAPAPAYDLTNNLDYLVADTDADGIADGADDSDFDGVSNIEEITAGSDGFFTVPEDPCDPNVDSRSCPTHPSH